MSFYPKLTLGFVFGIIVGMHVTVPPMYYSPDKTNTTFDNISNIRRVNSVVL